jgi:hypothetical protein
LYRRPFFVALFALVLLVLAVLLFQCPMLKWVIAERAQKTLGLRLEIKDLAVRWMKGDIQISGLAVAGPQGFEDDTLMTADTVYLALDWATVLSDRPRFNKVFLHIAEITVVRNASGAINFEQVRDNARQQASVGKQGTRADKGGPEGNDVFIRQGTLRLEKVTYKDYSGGTQAFVRSFPMPVSEIGVGNVTWDELEAALGVLATVGKSGPGPLFKALSGAKGIGERVDKLLKGIEKNLKETR